eukprot:jgi/Antlo1/849/1960
MEEKKKRLKDMLKYFNEIPPPLPGLQRVNLSLNEEFKDYDNSLEGIVPKRIYTDIFDILNIDIVELVYENLEHLYLEHHSSESFLRKSEYISADFFRKQEHRSELLKNLRLKEARQEYDDALFQDEDPDADSEIVHPKGAKVLVKIPIDFSESSFKAFSFEENEETISTSIDLQQKTLTINDKEYMIAGQDMGEFFVINICDNRAEAAEIDEYFKLKCGA